MILKRIHVDQHAIRRNKTQGTNDPPISVKTYNQNLKGDTVIIRDAEGVEVARFVYRPDKPLSCGARLWVETRLDVEVQ